MSGNNISHMAITSANQKHDNTSAILAITSAKNKILMAHFLVQLLIKVVTPTTTSMAITSDQQCQEHQPDGKNITIYPETTKQHGNNISQTRNISCKHNGNMAITFVNNITLP